MQCPDLSVEPGSRTLPGWADGAGMALPPQNDRSQPPSCAPDDHPVVRVQDILECISGRVYRFGISRGATLATARTAGGLGRYVASLWQVGGPKSAWWVRTEDDLLHQFPDEARAVRFFVTYLRRRADADC